MGKPKQTLLAGFNSLSGHLGVVAGGAIGFGIAGPPGIPYGGAAGALLGPMVFDQLTGRLPPNIRPPPGRRLQWVQGRLRWLTYPERLLIEKFERDFDESPLPESSEILEARNTILHNVVCLGVIPPRFREDTEQLEDLVPRLAAKEIPKRPMAAIRRLKSRVTHLSAVCITVHPAVIAVLIYMRDKLKIPLTINTDYEYGVLAIKNIIGRMTGGKPHDLLFLPDSAFLMAHYRDLPFNFTTDYRFLMPVCPQKQYVVRPTGRRPLEGLKGVNFFRYLDNSTGKELFRSIHENVGIPLKEVPHNIETREKILTDVDENVAIALWDPTHRHAIGSGKFYEVKELRHEYWLSMYGLRDTFQDDEPAQDFIRTFIYSWSCCKIDPAYALSALETEPSIKSGFQRGLYSFVRDRI